MNGHTRGRSADTGAGCRRRLTDEEFRVLIREARAEARRGFLGRPPPVETDFSFRTQHAEFGAPAH
ncbi:MULTISPECIES: hypothetical protein [Streptomyces]|uniref:hypothetical protein n=1 Tax=Streptomyces TaxID=1883 RepID=UPI0005BB722E|nr:hypothetical protein [Streptomyces sp. NRRL F-5193]